MAKDLWHRLTGAFVKGRRIPEDRAREAAVFKALDGHRYELAIRKAVQDRTLPQNSKLHVLARLVAEHTGEPLLRVKRRATLEALGLEVGTTREEILGRTIYEVRHTSDLTKDETSLVIERLLDNCRFLEITPPRDEDVEVMA